MDIIKEIESPYEKAFLCRITNSELDYLSAIRHYNDCNKYLLITGLSEYEVKGLFSFVGNNFGCDPCFQIDSFETGYEAELYAQLRAYRKAYRNLKDSVCSLQHFNTKFTILTTYLGQEIDTTNDRNKEKEN